MKKWIEVYQNEAGLLVEEWHETPWESYSILCRDVLRHTGLGFITNAADMIQSVVRAI